ncbi:unnamed protein product [Ixodes persulcatus]
MPNKRRYEMPQQTLETRLINLSYMLTVHMAKVIHSSINKEIQQRLENKCHILDTSPHIENQVTIYDSMHLFLWKTFIILFTHNDKHLKSQGDINPKQTKQ